MSTQTSSDPVRSLKALNGLRVIGGTPMAARIPADFERDVRKFVFDHFAERAAPPVLEQIMERFRLSRRRAFEVLQELEAARHLRLVPGTQRILMAFPFSAVATPFQVLVPGGRNYFANCAWDAVAFHAMLGERIRIASYCHHCAEPIAVELSKGSLTDAPNPPPLIFLSLPASRWWDDIVNTCSNHMVFFRSAGHLESWKAANPGLAGEALSIEHTHALGVPTYRDKMKLEYVRPAKAQLVAHFRSLGLTGDFWEL